MKINISYAIATTVAYLEEACRYSKNGRGPHPTNPSQAYIIKKTRSWRYQTFWYWFSRKLLGLRFFTRFNWYFIMHWMRYRLLTNYQVNTYRRWVGMHGLPVNSRLEPECKAISIAPSVYRNTPPPGNNRQLSVIWIIIKSRSCLIDILYISLAG